MKSPNVFLIAICSLYCDLHLIRRLTDAGSVHSAANQMHAQQEGALDATRKRAKCD